MSDLRKNIEVMKAELAKMEADLKEEEKYPLYFMERSSGIVVKFTGLTNGTVVSGIDQPQKRIGFRWYCWTNHNNEAWWAPLADYQETKELSQNGFYIETDGSIGEYRTSGYHVKKGCARATRELAVLASKNMGIRNILEAWVHEIQGNGRGNFYMVKSDGKYSIILTHSDCMGLVKMREDTGIYLRDKLNRGEIVLGNTCSG